MLDKALELLAPGWSNEYTATKNGVLCQFTDPDADRFSVAGAVMRAERDLKIPMGDMGDTQDYLSLKVPNGIVVLSENAKSITEILTTLRRVRDQAIKDLKAPPPKEPEDA